MTYPSLLPIPTTHVSTSEGKRETTEVLGNGWKIGPFETRGTRWMRSGGGAHRCHPSHTRREEERVLS